MAPTQSVSRSNQVPADRKPREATRTRVLVVEDFPVMADALVRLLEAAGDMDVVGHASTVIEAVHQAAEKTPDVVLMDLWLPDGTGIDAAMAMAGQPSPPAVVFLTGERSEGAILDALAAGASGFLEKTGPGDDIADAVRRVGRGEILFPREQMARLLAERRLGDSDRRRASLLASRLTGREMEVLALMAAGLLSPTIAEHLMIGVTTVRTHVQSILEKMEAHTKLEAVATAMKYGIIEIPLADRGHTDRGDKDPQAV
jgi:two-component system nitrate/nitrite response regulator NarL